MSEKKASVNVWIAGEEHVIRANAKPEYTESCAQYVDSRISDIRAQAGLLESHKAAILAALSITDECFQARAEPPRARREPPPVRPAEPRLAPGSPCAWNPR